ncbi:MAG: hypothetical protein J5965_19795, partial [Aeriscardovia sp.]|nr:hypothetical protein [Aeriscardovia sp.]
HRSHRNHRFESVTDRKVVIVIPVVVKTKSVKISDICVTLKNNQNNKYNIYVSKIVSQISRDSGNSWISTKYVLKPFGQKS